MRVALCTCPPEAADRLAGVLLEAGAACVNVLPAVVSHYVWEGAMQREAESLLVVKVAAERVEGVHAALRAAHPYQLPEWVVLAVDHDLTGSDYRRWVRGA